MNRSTTDNLLDPKTFEEQLESHENWLSNPDSGEQLRLQGVTIPSGTYSSKNLSQAILTGVTFEEGADFSHSKFVGANLRASTFQRTKLIGADFRNAELLVATFLDTNLEDAIFDNTSLRETNLAGDKLNLCRTSFQNSDLPKIQCNFDDKSKRSLGRIRIVCLKYWLRPGKNIRYNECNFRGAVQSQLSMDHWSILRREYSGSRMGLSLIMTALAFLPMIIQLFFWWNVGRIQSHVHKQHKETFIQQTNDVGAFIEKKPYIFDEAAWQKSQSLIATLKKEGSSESVLEKATELSSILLKASKNHSGLEKEPVITNWQDHYSDLRRWSNHWSVDGYKTTTVFSIIMGAERSFLYMVSSFVLIAYNFLLGFATMKICGFKDAEILTGISPSLKGYRPVWVIHRVFNVVRPLIIAISTMRIYDILREQVLLTTTT